MARRISARDVGKVEGWLVAVERVLGNLLAPQRPGSTSPGTRLLLGMQMLEELQADRPEPRLVRLAHAVAAKVKRKPPASSGLGAFVLLVDSLSQAVKSAADGGRPRRFRPTQEFHRTPPDLCRGVADQANLLLQLLRREVSVRDVGHLRAEAIRELADIWRMRAAPELDSKELAWLTEFVELTKKGVVTILHCNLAARLLISESLSQKLARRLRAKGMLPPLLQNGKPDWRPTPLALETLARTSIVG